jgi:hypothetical protein
LIAESKKQLLLVALGKVLRLLCCLQYLNMQVCNQALLVAQDLSIIKEGKIGNAKVGKQIG